jgi:hypothetical protein
MHAPQSATLVSFDRDEAELRVDGSHISVRVPRRRLGPHVGAPRLGTQYWVELAVVSVRAQGREDGAAPGVSASLEEELSRTVVEGTRGRRRPRPSGTWE